MQYIFWDKHFDVVHEPFNEQHKEIFRLQNRVVNLLCGDASPHELSPVLNGLIRYSQSHFKDEEALMAKYGYADLSGHQLEHERLVMRIFALTEELGKEHFNRDRLLAFLNTWITGHIMKVDMEYRIFFLEKLPAIKERIAGEETAAAASDSRAKTTGTPDNDENRAMNG